MCFCVHSVNRLQTVFNIIYPRRSLYPKQNVNFWFPNGSLEITYTKVNIL